MSQAFVPLDNRRRRLGGRVKDAVMNVFTKKRTLLFGAYWLCAFMLVPFRYAWAYIDPATTTYIIQIAAAIVISLGVSFGVVLYKFEMILTSIKVAVHGFARRFSEPGRGSKKSDVPRTGETTDEPMLLSEEDALAAGVLDYPIPVRTTYPLLAGPPTTPAAKGEVLAPAEKPSPSARLRSLAHTLWDEQRSFKDRLTSAVLASAAFTITFVVFSMLDSVVLNEGEMPFALHEIIWPVWIFGLCVWAALTFMLALLRGRVFTFALCLTTAGILCGYLQSTFFNSSLGTLIGLPLGWNELGIANVVTNSLIWIAVFTLVFFLGFTRRATLQRFFKRFLLYAPALLIAIQAVALLSIIPAGGGSEAYAQAPAQEQGPAQTLTTEHLYDVSSNKNIIIFLVDMLDEDFVVHIDEEDPAFFDSLDGFTRFTNNISKHNETFPSIVNLLTDYTFDPDIPGEDYIADAYAQGSFIEDIRAQGYSSDLYLDKGYTYTDAAQLKDIADNLDDSGYDIDFFASLEKLTRLSALKGAPLALKNTFAIDPGAFSLGALASTADGSALYEVNDFKFRENLNLEGLTAVSEPGHFAFYHLNGSHYPWNMDENAEYSESETSGEAMTKGAFVIINEYLEQMKELGVYEDATIIITGDHPIHYHWAQPETPRIVGLFVKPAGSGGTPLQTSAAPVTIENLRPTCVAAAGGDPTPWGKTYFEVPEDSAGVVRDYYNRYNEAGASVAYMAHYQVTGDARDWNNWELVETTSHDATKRHV